MYLGHQPLLLLDTRICASDSGVLLFLNPHTLDHVSCRQHTGGRLPARLQVVCFDIKREVRVFLHVRGGV